MTSWHSRIPDAILTVQASSHLYVNSSSLVVLLQIELRVAQKLIQQVPGAEKVVHSWRVSRDNFIRWLLSIQESECLEELQRRRKLAQSLVKCDVPLLVEVPAVVEEKIEKCRLSDLGPKIRIEKGKVTIEAESLREFQIQCLLLAKAVRNHPEEFEDLLLDNLGPPARRCPRAS